MNNSSIFFFFLVLFLYSYVLLFSFELQCFYSQFCCFLANERDSEVINGILESAGFKRNSEINKADLIIVNTCAIREGAEDKVLEEVAQSS